MQKIRGNQKVYKYSEGENNYDLIKKEVEEKSFFVYEYISLDELFLTLKRDYIQILLKINIPFGITTVIIFIINLALGIIFLMLGFGIIFLILFVNFIIRSYHFLLISRIVFTKKGIIVGKKIFRDQKDFLSSVGKYEKMFDEKIGKKSLLKEKITLYHKELLESHKSGFSKIMNHLSSKQAVIGFLAMAFYMLFLYTFYFLGYFLGILIFGIFGLLLKILIFFTKNAEIEITKKTGILEKNFSQMKKSYENISAKISGFDKGEIGNLENIIGKNFEIFYQNISLSLQNRDILMQEIQKYRYKDLFDFVLLEEYIKKNFNKPIFDMISLLEKVEQNILSGMKDLQSTLSSQSEFSGNLSQKQIHLEHQKDLVQYNLEKFKNSLL